MHPRQDRVLSKLQKQFNLSNSVTKLVFLSNSNPRIFFLVTNITVAVMNFVLNLFLNFRSPSCVTFMFTEKSSINFTSPVLLSCGIGASGIGFFKKSQIGFHPSLTCQMSKSSFGTVL